MLIALLAVLGVDLIVIVAIAALVISRRRWVTRQDGALRGALRVRSGEVDSLGEKVKRLGDDPVAATLRIGAATAEVAARHAHRESLFPHRDSVSAR